MFGWLFGGSDAADQTVDSVSSGIDKMFYTDEEKADANKEAFKLFIEYQKATQPQNLARRLIALIVVGLFSLLTLVSVISWPFNMEFSEFTQDILAQNVLPLTVVVISFYFYKRIKS